jgi:predicted mannosyl-3-phosphoglycerate phosphatase (HAD superfamily)
VAIKCPLCREHRQTSAVEQLARLQARLEPDLDRDRYFLHANDNNLSLLPRFLGKEKAVEHVLDQHLAGEPRLTLGMGDSLTDAPFLNLCDYAILPCDSQLARHTLVRSIAGDAGVPPHPPGAEV